MADATLLQKSVGYTLTARWLHWLTAVLVLFQIPAGLLIANFEMGPLYGLHKSVGVLILILVIIRLAWRWKHQHLPCRRKFPRSNALALAAFIGRFMRCWSYRP